MISVQVFSEGVKFDKQQERMIRRWFRRTYVLFYEYVFHADRTWTALPRHPLQLLLFSAFLWTYAFFSISSESFIESGMILSVIAASSSPANRRSKSSSSRPLLSGKNT